MKHKNQFFWKNQRGKEIDYIEESDGKFSAYEFKWTENYAKTPSDFFENYKANISVVNKENFIDFV
jgi:hypothetical protein